ncbi:MAG: tetratricopeptide repeat protein [Gammaproteobacteria bacterium]|nr:tetratricopeptide repeat protein [Gammaproteobacteria bacterium]
MNNVVRTTTLVETNVVKFYRVFVIFCAVLVLVSCAGGNAKQRFEVGNAASVVEHLDVDSDVERDFDKAMDLMNKNDYTQAVSLLTSVIEREQRLPAPYINIAIAQNKLGNAKAAEKNLIKALEIDIAHPVANNELGLLYRKSGKFKAARVAYENAIKRHPEYLPAKRNLGVLCDLYMHDFDCALEQYEDYLALEPGDKTMAIWVADVKRRLAK